MPMASPVRNIASRYLESLEDSTPTRLPLQQTFKFNSNATRGKLADSPDLDDLARQMNLDTPKSQMDLLRSRFDTPSATVSSFKTTPRSRSDSRSTTSDKWTSLDKPLTAPGEIAFKKASKDSKGYEYLCRIQAIKSWLEVVLGERIRQEPVELITYIQNGIYLAKLANVFLPVKKSVYTNDKKLEFRHTENINRFFKLLTYLEIPDLFRFELTDLYDAKDVPKVWFCLHAMSYKINTLDTSYPPIENKVGQLDFSEADVKAANRALVGHNLPNFSSADNEDVSSPGRNSYMNKTLTFTSPQNSPAKSSPGKSSARLAIPPRPTKITEVENPFRESQPSSHTSSYSLRIAQKPDLSVPKSSDFESRSALSYADRYSHVDKTSNYYSPELELHILHVIKLQALCKGAIFRYSMFVDKIMLRSFDLEFTQFFSKIRGNLVRARTVHRHRDELLLYMDEIVSLQSAARKKILRNYRSYAFNAKDDSSLLDFQCLLRGCTVRRRVESIKRELAQAERNVVQLQSILRAKPVHRNVSTLSIYRNRIEDNVVGLQSLARRALYQRSTNKNILSHLVENGGLIELQSICRGGQARNQVRRKLRGLYSLRQTLREFQSIAKGAILRTRLCNNVLITLIGEDIKMNELFAKARGNFLRKEVDYKKAVLAYVGESEIVPIQSMFRGVLLRFRKGMDVDDIYDNVSSIITLQAKIRTNAVTSQRQRMQRYYNANKDKVIKAQAVIRSKYTQTAYKALTNMKNPPLGVVRKFAYLLSDSGIDYQEELELTKWKDQILEKSKHNEELELQIENLDIKLSLLDKNKITIEDFMKHNNKFKTYKPTPPKLGVSKNLNSSSKKRIDLYLSMFYFLQTKPTYWIRLFKGHSPSNRGQYVKSLQYHILLIFPLHKGAVNSHMREEYFFLKFVCALMEHDISSSCKNITDITKVKTAFWVDFIVDFNNHIYQRMHLKQLLGRTVERIVDDDEMTFESDPSKIYSQMRDQEMKIHGSSDKLETISAQDAIKDEEVSAAFVRNLIALREAATDTMETIHGIIPQLPMHIRLVAHESYRLSQIHFPDHNEQHHLAVAGVVLIKHYLGNIMQYPENYGYSTRDPYASHSGRPSEASQNLKYLSRVLLQIFSMKAFSDNFMKPLNEFVLSFVETAKSIIKEVINVKLLEVEFEMNDYDDIVTHQRPQLTMSVSDMISIEKLITQNIDVIAPSFDDQLFSIANELNNVVNSADDYVTLTELGSLTLTLSPTTKEDSVADSKSRTLFAQAKRCLLYIIRVQDGDDLLELFIQGIKPVHEQTFLEIIQSEIEEKNSGGKFKEASNPYKRSSLGDLSKMSYVELKKMALKVIIQLESMGQVSRKNSFQELLNQIVVDIKTKHSQRVSRKAQLKIAGDTVNKLLEKENFLKKQLDDYNKHIDMVLSDLQLKPKDKKIFNIIPVFSKQYFYHRQLKKNNRLPKFGSYKYSAKKLIDQKIVLDIGGELHNKHASSSKLDFMFSCHKTGNFIIEVASGSVSVPGACNTITLDMLLDYQYENKKKWNMFDGMVIFDTDNLAALIFRKFYDIKKD